MKRKLLIICGISVMLLAGCTKSTIVTGGTVAPVFETRDDIVLDWGQIGDDLDEMFLENEDYPMAVSINYNAQEDSELSLNLMVKEGTTPEEAVVFANAVVKALNDEAAIQDFSIAASTETTYGGFFDKTNLHLIVMPDGMMEAKSTWLVDMTIPAGSNEPIAAIEGATAMETAAEDEAGAAEEDENTDEADGEESTGAAE